MKTNNRVSGRNVRLSGKKMLALLLCLIISLSAFAMPVSVGAVTADELNLLPASAGELSEKIWLNTEHGATLTYNQDGSTEINSPASWPTFRLLAAAEFTPTASPLYLYYDFTLTGGVMTLDFHVNDSNDNLNDADKNIFKNNVTGTGGNLTARNAPYRGVINVTEVFGEDIDVINAITGIVSHNGVCLVMRELRLSVIPPETPPDLNLLPESAGELNQKVWLDTGTGASLAYKLDGSTEIHVPTANNWPTFKFLAAADYIPFASPLYLYYDFSMTGGVMKLDFHVNESGEDLNSSAKNIFLNNARDPVGNLAARNAPYKGVLNITEIFGTDVDIINSVVGIFSVGGSEYITFYELRLSAVPPEELNLIPADSRELPLVRCQPNAVSSLDPDGSLRIYNPSSWPHFFFDVATGFVPPASPLYLYYDFTFTGGDMKLDFHVNNDTNTGGATKNIFLNNAVDPVGNIHGRATPYKGVINVTDVFGTNINIINGITGIISGTDISLIFRELRLSIVPPDVFELDLLPAAQAELAEKIYNGSPGAMTMSYDGGSGYTQLNATAGWPMFAFNDATDRFFCSSPLYLSYDFTLTGEGRSFGLDFHVNGDVDYSNWTKNIFTDNSGAATAPGVYTGVINVTDVFGYDITKINSILGIFGGSGDAAGSIVFRELKLYTVSPEFMFKNVRNHLLKRPTELDVVKFWGTVDITVLLGLKEKSLPDTVGTALSPDPGDSLSLPAGIEKKNNLF